MSKRSKPQAEMTVRQMARLGGLATSRKYPKRTRRKWTSQGGQARARKYSRVQLRAWAQQGGRKPWKITPQVRKRILALLAQGKKHREIAEQFNVSTRTIGRIVGR